jgi:hypothetical protein
MTENDKTSKIFLVDTISSEGLFGLFSIFFISTFSIFLAIVLMLPTYQTIPFQQSLVIISISIFLIGYATILVAIIIYYIIRFSKFFNSLYQFHKKGFIIITLLLVIIVPSIIASMLTTSTEFLYKAVGFAVLTIMGVILIMMQEILVDLAKPYTTRISNFMSNRSLTSQKSGESGEETKKIINLFLSEISRIEKNLNLIPDDTKYSSETRNQEIVKYAISLYKAGNPQNFQNIPVFSQYSKEIMQFSEPLREKLFEFYDTIQVIHRNENFDFVPGTNQKFFQINAYFENARKAKNLILELKELIKNELGESI